MTIEELRSRLGRVGIWTTPPAAAGQDPEALGQAIPSGAAAVASRVREHLEAGADHVVVQPLAASGGFAAGQLGNLADVLAGLMS